MRFEDLLTVTPNGLYCPSGDFYVDPRRAVNRAVITHAHADHARAGHKTVLAHPLTLAVIKHRIDATVRGQPLEYGEAFHSNGVRVTLHPAGHVPGSAQVRLEYKGLVVVVTGDYKLEPDGLSQAYEQQRCHWFISECTFGIPVFRWEPQRDVMMQIVRQYELNRSRGVTTVLAAYALGKAQRLLHLLAPAIGDIAVHRSIATINAVLETAGLPLPRAITMNSAALSDHTPSRLIIATSQSLREPWVQHLGPYIVSTVSGWMAMPSRRRPGFGITLSDHSDWPALNQAVRDTGAERISLAHGYVKEFSRSLQRDGFRADILGEETKPDTSRPEGEQLALQF